MTGMWEKARGRLTESVLNVLAENLKKASSLILCVDKIRLALE